MVAAGDIENLEELTVGGKRSLVGLQNESEGPDILTRVALYDLGGKRALSELTPALEDMGLRVVEEVPTRVAGADDLFIHDFGVVDEAGHQIDLAEAGERVAETLSAVWDGSAESDSLHRLVLVAGLTHRQVAILRAYETYWRRVSSIFTVNYVNDALVGHPEIAADLIRLFELRFDPASDGRGYEELRSELLASLDAVPSLDQDRILRGFLRLIEATVRTNAYRSDRRCLAFKLQSAGVPDMPSPRPFVEVFVIGDDVEGIHLRAGRRARGGIRWSERREDYRTEVLGLMKAQNTKNAIIVPTGAKGGFVVRRPPADPEAIPDAVRASYETFIRGLLDVSDNLVDGEAVHPPQVRVHDEPDPYLVVAADKGTARFSDTANRIAAEYGFWLDDAFASGGATGYDHKGLGITARGAWKSLERHFLADGIDPHRDAFAAVGIGDMSGDVFGNGMLGSETIRLVAAFDHRHIFLDPDPDPAVSYRERRRLFELPRSSWDNYDRSLISTGGGVFPRTAKHLEISEQAQAALGTDVASATPAELVSIILRAPVDVLWNGGIGTYVKASTETHEDVGDRSNDAVRVDGSELRCRIVVEGGNLGLTQRGRIEFAAGDGKINTDFIDNSGGVNCSDREVNLKILLRMAEQRGEIERPERDALMAAEADNVVAAILRDSFKQAQSLSLEEQASRDRIDAYERLMSDLEEEGMLSRDIEALPSTQQMAERARAGAGMSRPELAVLLAYSKRRLAEAVIESDLPDEWALRDDLAGYFPGAIAERFGALAWEHPLRRELLATIIANDVVDSQGPTFVSRLASRAGSSEAEVVAAYRTARQVVGGPGRRREIEALAGTVEPEIWAELMAANDRLVATLTRWYLRRGTSADASDAAGNLRKMEAEVGEWGSLQWRLERSARIERLKAAGVPDAIARRTVFAFDMVHGPDIVEVAAATGRPPVEVARVFYRIGQTLLLDDLERVAAGVSLADPWQRWALQTVEDDLLEVRRSLAETVLSESGGHPVDPAIEQFLSRRRDAATRVVELIRSIESGGVDDAAPLMVAVRQIEALVS
jgi:glutamate dehydrogenase